MASDDKLTATRAEAQVEEPPSRARRARRSIAVFKKKIEEASRIDTDFVSKLLSQSSAGLRSRKQELRAVRAKDLFDALKEANEPINAQTVEKLHDAFVKEMTATRVSVPRQGGSRSLLTSMVQGISEIDAASLFEAVDADQSGQITLNEAAQQLDLHKRHEASRRFNRRLLMLAGTLAVVVFILLGGMAGAMR
ncbi:hypothetical protein AB1Y20_011749 [Prymnesium parvum]|uniref:EF-hand domain-containing protein n=1 Tax=Prymnesium parvum TaxID=97485 RepID=A0AB34IKA6_PRYPA